MKSYQFVHVSAVIGQMCIAHARACLPNGKEKLTETDYRALINFEKQSQVYRTAKAKWDIQVKVYSAYRANTGSPRQGPKPNSPGEEPRPPTVPDAYKSFWALVEVEGGDNYDISYRVIEMHIYEGRISSFVLDKNGIPKRLTQRSFILNRQYGELSGGIYWSGLLPWLVSRNKATDYSPVVILNEDFEYFMEHGQPGRAETESIKKSKGGAPPKFHWVELINEGVRLYDELGPPHPDDDDPKWRSHAGLIERLQYWYSEKYGHEPSRTSVQSRIPEILKKFETMRGQ